MDEIYQHNQKRWNALARANALFSRPALALDEARVVFREVARVLREGGLYHLQCANPFSCGLTPRDWNGSGYNLKYPYIEGVSIESEDQPWAYSRSDTNQPIPMLREYRHTLGTLVNGLIEEGFVLRHLSEGMDMYPDLEAEPGTWDHFVAYAPP